MSGGGAGARDESCAAEVVVDSRKMTSCVHVVTSPALQLLLCWSRSISPGYPMIEPFFPVAADTIRLLSGDLLSTLHSIPSRKWLTRNQPALTPAQSRHPILPPTLFISRRFRGDNSMACYTSCTRTVLAAAAAAAASSASAPAPTSPCAGSSPRGASTASEGPAPTSGG